MPHSRRSAGVVERRLEIGKQPLAIESSPFERRL
jgi:hypothetical protein